jgi:ribonuclease VapC
VIVVDTSALMAVLLREPQRDRCLEILGTAPELAMSAGTLTEAFVAAEYRGVGSGMQQLVASMKLEIVPATADTAALALTAFRQFGKGRHPAKLNFGDCFSYVLAKHYDCPLLFIGNDFSQTDIRSAL